MEPYSHSFLKKPGLKSTDIKPRIFAFVDLCFRDGFDDHRLSNQFNENLKSLSIHQPVHTLSTYIQELVNMTVAKKLFALHFNSPSQ